MKKISDKQLLKKLMLPILYGVNEQTYMGITVFRGLFKKNELIEDKKNNCFKYNDFALTNNWFLYNGFVFFDSIEKSLKYREFLLKEAIKVKKKEILKLNKDLIFTIECIDEKKKYGNIKRKSLEKTFYSK